MLTLQLQTSDHTPEEERSYSCLAIIEFISIVLYISRVKGSALIRNVILKVC